MERSGGHQGPALRCAGGRRASSAPNRLLTDTEMVVTFGDTGAQCVGTKHCVNDKMKTGSDKCCWCNSPRTHRVCCDCTTGSKSCSYTSTKSCQNDGSPSKRYCADLVGNPDNCGVCSGSGAFNEDGICGGIVEASGDNCPCVDS